MSRSSRQSRNPSRRSTNSVAAALALVIVWPAPALEGAAGPTSLSGRLLTTEEKPVVDGSISFEPLASTCGLESHGPATSPGQLRTDRRGRFRIELSYPQPGRLRVESPGFLSVAMDVAPAYFSRHVAPAVLHRAVMTRVKVTDTTGHAVTNAKVRVLGFSLDSAWRVEARAATTSAEGDLSLLMGVGEVAQWAVEGFDVTSASGKPGQGYELQVREAAARSRFGARPRPPTVARGRVGLPRERSVRAFATSPGLLGGEGRGRSVQVTEAEGMIRIELSRPRMLRGLVFEEGGTPLAGARVSVPGGNSGLEGYCDQEGRFALGPLRGGPYALLFESDGYGSVLRHVDVPTGAGVPPPVRQVLHPEAVVSGLAMDEGGSPIRDIEVLVSRTGALSWPFDRQGRPLRKSEATTDAAGSFSVGQLSPGSEVEIWAYGEGYRPTSRRLAVTGPDVTVELMLARTVALGGRLGNDRGEPVSKAEVLLTPLLDGEPLKGQTLEALVDEVGAFRFVGAPEGPNLLEVGAGGLAPLRLRLALPLLQPGPLRVTLQPEASLVGTLRDENLKPIAGAMVWVTPPGGSRLDLPVPGTATDEAGEFYLPRQPLGPVVVEVTHAGYERELLQLTLEPGEQRLDVVLRRQP